MGFLNPWLLAAAAAVAVPVFLHLFHRHESRRLSFPALRYLLRTEREHARRIRLRQLLLLLLRATVIVLLVLAGARPFLRGGAGAHLPTALAIVLDNSMSSGRVVGDERVLDVLKRRAQAALDRTGEDDVVWVMRAGEPWDVATPGDVARARDRVATTEVSAAAGDLTDAVRRARGLVRQAGLPAAEVHVLSDLQATALPADAETGNSPEPPVLVLGGAGPVGANHYLGSVLVGAGLAPLAGRRSELAVGIGGDRSEAAAAADFPLRLVIDDRIRGAARTPAGSSALLPFGPFPAGWVAGYVETDPDALGGDDRRWFAVAVQPPPIVSVRGGTPFFLEQALAVLADGGRLRRADAGADVVIAVSGEGAGAVATGATVVVIPPAQPNLLPALNRRLGEAAIPWRYEALGAVGETRVSEHRLPIPLEELRVTDGYRIAPTREGASHDVLARLSDGTPWLVRGATAGGEYRLLGSALEPGATALPVSALMVPLLEWLISSSPRGASARSLDAGAPLPLPSTATAVRTPGGDSHPVDQAREFRLTREAGIYQVMAGDRVLDQVAMNPPLRESLLAAADAEAVARALGGGVRLVADSSAWDAAVFATRQGSELWRPLLVLALLLLVAESVAAASGARPGPVRAEAT